MLPKRRRITRNDFPSGRDGRVIHGQHFSLRFVPDPSTPTPDKNIRVGAPTTSRVGIVVSKKVAHTSVARHALKRRAYNIFQQRDKHTPLPSGRYVLFAKKDAQTLSFKELETEIKNILKTLLY